MVPNVFSVAIVFFLLLLAIYGMIGAIFNYRELMKQSYSHGKWPFNQKPIYIIFMSIQLCYLIPAILGLVSVMKNIKDYLTYSFFILLGIFTPLLVFGGVCLRVSSTDLRTDMYNAFRKNLIDDADLDWLSDVQYRYNCCGVFSYLDWGLFKVALPNGNTSVPDSCCRKEIFIPPVNCGVGYLTPSKSRAEATKFIYTDGCSTEISTMLWNNSKWIGAEMIIAALVTLAVAAMIFYDTLRSLSASQHNTSGHKNHNGDTTTNFDVNNNEPNENNTPVSSERSRRTINKNISSNTPSRSNNKPKPSVVINVKREKSSKSSHHKKSKGSNNKFGGPEGSRCGRKEHGVNHRNLFKKYWNPAGSNTNLIVNKGTRPNSTMKQKLLYPNGYDFDIDSDGSVTNVMRRNLEMLMDPIAGNFSTLSTTPKPSGSLNFSAPQNSTSPNPRGKFEEKVLQEPNLSHYSSLPLVNPNILTNLNAIQITNALQALLPFCSGSHYHRYLPPKFSKHSSEPSSPGVNFLPGKFTSPSMTHSTTLATIQEETESLKSGAGSASPKGASPNTTPQSLSQKTSSSSADDYNTSQPCSDSEGSSPKGIIIEIVDEKYQDSSNPCAMEETNGAFGINDAINEANNFGIKSNDNISKLFLEFQDINENTNSSFESFNGLNSMGTEGMSVDSETIAHQENVNVDIGNDIMCRRDLSTNCMTDDVSLNIEILSGHENISSIVQNSI